MKISIFKKRNKTYKKKKKKEKLYSGSIPIKLFHTAANKLYLFSKIFEIIFIEV